VKTSFAVFLHAHINPQVADNPEFELHCTDQARWLRLHPTALANFVSESNASAQVYDMWGVGFVNWPDIPWRRSVAEFILSHPTIRAAIPREALAKTEKEVALCFPITNYTLS
jgi:hypothetical protein